MLEPLVVEYRRGWRVRIIDDRGWSFRPLKDHPGYVELLQANGERVTATEEEMYGELVTHHKHTVTVNINHPMYVAHFGDRTAKILGETDWNKWDGEY